MKIDSSWIYSSCQVGARIWILSCFIANVNTNTISGVLSYGNMTLKHAIEHVKRVGISFHYEEPLGYGILHGLRQIPEIKEYLLLAADIL